MNLSVEKGNNDVKTNVNHKDGLDKQHTINTYDLNRQLK